MIMSEGFELFPGLFFINYLITYLIFRKHIKCLLGSLLGFILALFILLFMADSGFYHLPAIWKLFQMPLVYGMPFLISAIILSLLITKIFISINGQVLSYLKIKRLRIEKNNHKNHKKNYLPEKILFCYAGGWITGLFFLALGRKNKILYFHAMQSVVTSIILIGILIMFLPFGGLMIYLVLFFIGVFWFILIFKATEISKENELFKLPIIGSFVERQQNLEKSFLWIYPIFWPIINLLITFVFVFYLQYSSFPTSTQSIILFINFISVIVIFPLVALLANFAYYPYTEKYLERLVILYISLILLFSNIYFVLIFFSLDSAPFEGFQSNLWVLASPSEGLIIPFENALETYIDCFHYSVVTITTLGFGDMHPIRWYTKLVTDFEVLIGIAVTVISIGRFFSERNNR